MTVNIMDERGEHRLAGRVAWWAGVVCAGFLTAVMLGFLMAHHDRGGGAMSPAKLGVLAVMAALLAGGGAALFRWRRVAMAGNALKGPGQRASHRLLAWSGALGGVIGLAMALTAGVTDDGDHLGILSGAIPAWFAVAVAIAWGVILPVISWRWHHVIDEHERDAYRDGAVAGYYLMTIGAPVWWFLGRGGLAPAVDGMAVFLAVVVVSGAVWMWRKYT